MAEAASMPQRAFRRLHWATLATAGLLGGCQTVLPRGVEPPAPTTRAPAATAPRVEPGVQAGLPRDEGRNRVALLVPLSGSNAGVGQSIANATMLALLDTQNRSVRITNYDTATGAANAAQRAIAEGAQLILGPLLADDVRAVAPVAKAAKVPVLSFSNDTGVAGNGTYVMGYVPAQSVDRVVSYARGRGVTSFAGLVPNGLYGERASTSFLRAVEGAGGQVVSLQAYGRTSGGVATAVQRLNTKAPYDAVLIADGGATAAAAAPLVKRGVGAGTRILGTELWNSEANIGARATLTGAWYASVSNGLYRQYAAKYRTRFGAAPYRLSSLGYDSVLLTVRIARDWAVGTPFPEAKLRDGDGFAGLDGAFRFGRDGVAERALEVQEIRGGTTVTVSPAPSGFGK
ncbi:penicillin-binding protein activator [Microvirga sp. SRT01]|jgi:ABC-type branched-subunit amino acid transport system substrate-binding protein|uniref:Penicillin-binding protein activator n=1 Tax=Sphingomonas longa TaxID=2778730 RepID=A0ABS2DCJ8_9SPHN|nr:MULTISPECIES: penicillin-binding protein activator [Alphaproteobacteria]MBM6578238.1 penicillin-binding protein activator [Sphingomonas sp. BT552]MBR7711279.1 penicillin-binding protein activator [Microvirga sp. SRT01]